MLIYSKFYENGETEIKYWYHVNVISRLGGCPTSLYSEKDGLLLDLPSLFYPPPCPWLVDPVVGQWEQ
jgi:hypothetical protein